MAHLTLAGASDDGRRLVLVDDEGTEHTLDLTAALRAAVGGSARPGPSRPGQMEKKMDSVLRPRDIQARIRAGESAEAVAQAAQTSVDKIMVYAGPVLAERAHMAQRAQRSSLRRTGGEGGVRTLGEAVESHLRSLNVDPDAVEWDAWRREDGRWTLVAGFSTTAREGSASFTFDPPGNFVMLDDDDARWLVGEVREAPGGGPVAPVPVRDDLEERRRRLSPVPGTDPGRDELPLGDDAIELVADPSPAAHDQAGDPATTDTPLEAFLDDSPASDDPGLREEAAHAAAADVPPGEHDQDEAEPEDAPQRRPVQKKRGRASVPSWDEIMFGGGDK